MLHRLAPVAVALAALPLLSLAASQQPASSAASLQQRLQEKFEELHKAGAFSGGTAGFVLADGTSFGMAVGVSDRTAGTPMTPTDRLLLGSVGKTYAAAIAIQMIHVSANPDKVWTGPDRLAYLFDARRFAVNPQFEWTGGGLAVTALDLAK